MKAINNRDYSTLIAAATQKIPCDLTVKNVKLVNVLTGEIYPASVDVKDGVIVHVQPGEACDSQSKTTVDGQGKYLLPGFAVCFLIITLLVLLCTWEWLKKLMLRIIDKLPDNGKLGEKKAGWRESINLMYTEMQNLLSQK